MNKNEIPVSNPFDPDGFRSEGHKIIDLLANYLKEVLDGDAMPVLPWNDPDKLVEDFLFTTGGGENEPVDQYMRRIIDNSNHLLHPRYIGHQLTSPLPLTALIQLCTALLNNGSAVYEMGPVNMAMERNVVNRFAALIGYPEGYDGIFTHGGTAGNLTAMLAARQNMADYNIWEDGIREAGRPGYIISEQSHYSVGRAVKIAGLGDSCIVKVPSGSGYKMNTGMLEDVKHKAEDKGIKVISVVANACSTATGSYDDLEAIADFCNKHNLWMHVDGAHGMGVLFTEKYRSRVKGIDRADSVIIDFHKMFLVPALNTLVMFRNGNTSYETFAQKASYLFNKTDNNIWYNGATRTIECTKSSLGIIAYTALKYYGNNYYREYIESRYDLAIRFAEMVRTNPELELCTEPDANIVCFRFVPAEYKNDDLNKINAAIRDKIIKEGSFYIVQVELEARIWIRVTIINPVTTVDELHELLTKITVAGKEITGLE
jgi:L-2,4-diaminobutyrate decarboxylase